MGGETRITDESLDHYLKEIRQFPLLDRSQEVEIGRRIQAGDAHAVEELVRSNLRFVVSVAKQFRERGVGLEDLIQEGNVGLVLAAQRFDPEQGVRFISYAVWRIRERLYTTVAAQGRCVRIPLSRAGDFARLHRDAAKLAQRFGYEPGLDELAHATGLPREAIDELRMAIATEVRLDAPARLGDGDQGRSAWEVFLQGSAEDDPADDVEREIHGAELRRAVDRLKPREARVLRMLYGLTTGEPMTLTQVGEELGVSIERVRQLRHRALCHLRQMPLGAQLFTEV